MSAICNRAGWKMGGSRDKYIKYESAGDQILGRVICSLNPLFAVSPPFFNMCGEELEEEDDARSRKEAGQLGMWDLILVQVKELIVQGKLLSFMNRFPISFTFLHITASGDLLP